MYFPDRFCSVYAPLMQFYFSLCHFSLQLALGHFAQFSFWAALFGGNCFGELSMNYVVLARRF